MNYPSITVVIPIYGTERYIRKCIESVVNQTFKDIEILCVDDCSPDNSHVIVEEFSRIDSRVKLIKHEKNLGQGGARNTAIKQAKAAYIASVDSDDYMQSDMLQKLWGEAQNESFDIICCGYKQVNERNEELSRKVFSDEVIDKSIKDVDNIFTLMNPSIWNKLWKKSLFIDNNIFFPENVYFEDLATIPLLVTKAKKIKMIEPCLYSYLIRDESVTTTHSSKHIIDYFKVYELLHAFLKDNQMDKYSKKLRWLINDGMRFHGLNVSYSTSMERKELLQYLRHLLMMKTGFFDLHEVLIEKDQDQLLALLSGTKMLNDLTGTEMTPKRELNFLQRHFCQLFGYLVKPSLSENQLLSYNANPESFFSNSKNTLVRRLGILFKIIK